MLVRFAMCWGSGSSASWLRGCECFALSQGCFGGLCSNPRHRSVLVGMSEAAAAAGRRSRTGLTPARGLVWFLDTVPASQFRAGRAGEGLNQQWSACCTSQLPGEMLAQAGALGCSAWEGTAGAAPGLSCTQGHWGSTASRMSGSPTPCCCGHTCTCELSSSDPKTWLARSPVSQTVPRYDRRGSVHPPRAPASARKLSAPHSSGTQKLLAEA